VAQGAVCEPEALMASHTLPPYPDESRKAKETGQVLLRLTIAKNGHVSGARVAHSSGFARLDQAAASYVRQHYLWRPLPCGSAQTNLKVVFSLADVPADRAPAHP
jgi:TonB family protein